MILGSSYGPNKNRFLMRKVLISLAVIASTLITTACSTLSEWGDSASDTVADWSLVHKPTIQQGNVITQQMLDELKPGMSKEQVRFLLGTPALVDVFHQERWDYLYWLKKPSEEPVVKQISLFFENETLARIEGEYVPGVEGEAQNLEEIVVPVPDNSGSKGIFTRTLEAVGVKKDD